MINCKLPSTNTYHKEWFGEVPVHWRTIRIASLFKEVNRPSDPQLPVLSVSIHSGVSDKQLENEDRDRIVNLSEDRTKYQRVEDGDLVYNMMRAWQGAFGTVTVDGLVSPAYVVAEPKTEFRTKFVELLLQTKPGTEEVKRFSKGIADFRLRLYWEHFRNIQICMPSICEQDRILSYLKCETDRIDSLIEKKARFIELLIEKRRSIIVKSVTRGLDASVPTKHSGVKWLGLVPSHWEVKRLKYLCNVTTGNRDTTDANESGEYPFFVRSQNIERIDSYAADCEAILTAGDGAGVGKIYHYVVGKFDFHQRVYMLFGFREVSGKYLYYYLLTLFAAVALDGGAKSTVDSLRMPVFMNFSVAFPTIEEQKQLISFLEDRCSHIDILIQKTESSIELLREHKSAIIYSAVTGKVDIRGTSPTAMEAAA